MKICHFIFILWKIKMVKAAFLWGINVYLTNKLQSSSASQQEASSMLTKSQSVSTSVNMGYIRKHLDLCVCSNFQIQPRTKKKELCNTNTSPCCQHWHACETQGLVKQEIACTILGTNKRGQRCSLIGLWAVAVATKHHCKLHRLSKGSGLRQEVYWSFPSSDMKSHQWQLPAWARSRRCGWW